jgi:serralysin
MSYDIVAPAPGPGGFAATPMPLDILAMQHIYGANLSYRTGADVYGLDNRSYRTIWDAGGSDTLDASSWAEPAGVLLDLREGAFSGRFDGVRRTAIAYDAVIENAVGSDREDELIGNGAANRLEGGAGDDWLTGGAGADRLAGGAGRDVLVGAPNDLRLHGGSGIDTLQIAGARLDLRLEAGTGITDIERIKLNGRGDTRITVDAASVLDLSTTRDILVIAGDSSDTVVIEGGVIDQGISGAFHRYQLGAATLLVDGDVTVVV